MVPSFRRIVPSTTTTLSLATVLLGTLSGCASYSGRPLLDSGAASSYLEHRERDGLHIAVLNLSEERSTVKHFDRDLPDFRFVPVQLLVELDSSSDAAFTLRREDLNLVLDDGTRLQAADALDVIESVSYSHWRSFFGFLLLLPGPFVASSVNGANEELENDYLAKALRNVRISPNMRTFQGAVFFELRDDMGDLAGMEDAFVEVSVYREGSGRGSLGERLEFPVHFSN